MPHESTVAHEQEFVADSPIFSRSRQTSVLDEKEKESAAAITNPIQVKVSLEQKARHNASSIHHWNIERVLYQTYCP